MAEVKGKKLILEIDVESGEIVVKNEKGRKAGVIPNIGALRGGTISDAETITIMGVHKSPGCRYVNIRGRWYRVCS
jgi:hypothetical protein